MYQTESNPPPIRVSFPRADTIFAIGEFNGWSTVATPLRKIAADQWELREPAHTFDAERLAFFVIPEGSRIGRVIRYRDLNPV